MPNNNIAPNNLNLIKLAYAKMPFGRYQGSYLSELPEGYVVWFRQKGFPKGELGNQLNEIYEIKANGLEHILRKIRSTYPAPNNN
jgi:uncharacterized protein